MVSLIKVLKCQSVQNNVSFERFIPLKCDHLLLKGLRSALLAIEGVEIMSDNVVGSADYVIYGGGIGGEKLFAAEDFARRAGAQLLLPEASIGEYAKIFGVSTTTLTAEML